MAIIVSCPQEVKLFMLGALFCGCRAGHLEQRESGLINNHTYPIRSLSLSFRSSCLPALISALFLSLFLTFFPSLPRLLCRFSFVFLPLLFPFFLFFLPSFLSPLPIKANLQQRVRAKIKSELICHERAPLLDHDCCGYDHATLMSICIPELTI